MRGRKPAKGWKWKILQTKKDPEHPPTHLQRPLLCFPKDPPRTHWSPRLNRITFAAWLVYNKKKNNPNSKGIGAAQMVIVSGVPTSALGTWPAQIWFTLILCFEILCLEQEAPTVLPRKRTKAESPKQRPFVWVKVETWEEVLRLVPGLAG